MLLAKHEANMKRREEEGLYPTPSKTSSPSVKDSYNIIHRTPNAKVANFQD